MIFLLREHAREIMDLPEGWRAFQVAVNPGDHPMNPTSFSPAVPPGFFMLQGAVPIGTRKDGRPKWPPLKDCQTVYISEHDHDKWKAAWEARTGKCMTCLGEGKQVTGCGIDGTRYKTCSRCNGSGKAPMPTRVNDEHGRSDTD